MIGIILVSIITLGVVAPALGQDPAERNYLCPVLNPRHEEKPKVTGWAQERVEEKLNRGVLAIPADKGQVYVGWRFLKTDSPGTSFNVYRSIGNGKAVKLNNKPVTVTTVVWWDGELTRELLDGNHIKNKKSK